MEKKSTPKYLQSILHWPNTHEYIALIEPSSLHWRKWMFPFHYRPQLQITSFFFSGKNSVPIFPSPSSDFFRLEFIQGLCILLQNSYVQQPCYVQKILFLCSNPPPLFLTIFSPSQYIDPLQVGINIDLSVQAENFNVCYYLHNTQFGSLMLITTI